MPLGIRLSIVMLRVLHRPREREREERLFD
jgi:hypothetical protein